MAVEHKVEVNDQWLSIKVRPALFNKIKKVADQKGFSMGEAIQSLETVLYKNFPHNGDIAELFRCNECRPKIIESIKKTGYWPAETKIVEVIKVVEVPVAKVETGSIKHLSYEIPRKHLR